MKLERKPIRWMDYDQHDFDGWRQLCVVKTGMGLKMKTWRTGSINQRREVRKGSLECYLNKGVRIAQSVACLASD